ncbi:M23/M56 family metallopeptidase [Marinifilum fragile]|uniref:M23/M56 family metallopeptidase n=1 Tax=Marinifilum fragile TaxID=570161 RepID=UPI002AA8E379|nr:M23/M56 family metallopeptidase [Marinifilum fragile]
MSEFLQYLIESSVGMAAFYLLYKVFLARDTFVMRNRIYLLFSVLISLLIPIFSFTTIQEPNAIVNQFALDPVYEFTTDLAGGMKVVKESFQIESISVLFLIYLLGVVFSFFRISKHLIGILKTISANEIEIKQNLKIVSVQENTSPYSFFRYVFLNPRLTSESDQKHILLHESVHVKQYHTMDLIFVEIAKVLMWFNPFIYFIQHSLIEMHEYLADRACINSGTDRIEYQNALVQNIEGRMNLALTSAFNSSLTLKRIKMIKKIKSSYLSNLKLLAVIPVICLSILCFGFKDINKEKSTLLSMTKPAYKFPIEAGKNVKITSVYGKRMHPILKKEKFHRGVDVSAPMGTPIYAVADGVVKKVNSKFTKGKGYGRFIIIDHADGISSLYSQMASYSVKEGEKVKKGDKIGTVGTSGISTGPHLHFEFKKDGEYVDPMKYLSPQIVQ